MSFKKVDNIIIENARIIFLQTLRERKTKYNRAGNRNFCVIIDDPEQAPKLTEDKLECVNPGTP